MTERVTIRLTPALMRRLDRFAEARGVTRAEAVRVAILETALSPEERRGLPDRDELLGLLTDKARGVASVPAIRVLLDELRRDRAQLVEPSKSTIDDLSKRRGRRGR